MLFELEIRGERGAYQVEVLHSEGAGRPRGQLDLDPEAILSRRTELENAVLASSVQSRRIVPAAEEPLQMVGQQLFEALFTGQVYGAYRASLGAAQQQQKRLGVVLRIIEPELAALPWEAMFDPEIEEYLCRTEPLIRRVDAPYTAEPLEVSPPLRILGLVASPRGLPILDVAAEKRHLEEALAKPQAAGLVELVWAPDASWEGIHEQMLSDTWHILHFIGHGDYDIVRQEGVLALVGPDGQADLVEAGRLRDLLCEAEPTPRLVVLNSCSSGKGGVGDLFSGTAAALVQRGISAVAAMQFSITDGAAIRFAHGFYTAIAHGRPVDEAVRSGRVGILGSARTLEWITPVLYVKSDSSQLFRLTGMPVPQPGTGTAGPASRPDLPADGTPVPAHAAPASATGTVADAGKATAGNGTPTASGGHLTAEIGEEIPGRTGPGSGPALGRRLRPRWLLVAAAAVMAVIAVIVVITLPHAAPRSPAGWPYATGSAIYTRPFVIDHAVYVGSTNGHVYALGAGTGAVRWRYPRTSAIGAVYSRPGVADHTVYFGSDNGRIYAVNASNGAGRWSRLCSVPGDPVRSSPVFIDGVIYAGTQGGYVCALTQGGGRYWNPVRLGSAAASSPAVAHAPGTPISQALLYFGSGSGHVYALSAQTGQVRWQYPGRDQAPMGSVVSRPTLSFSGSALYVGSSDGHVYALDSARGTIRWKYPGTNAGVGAVDSPPAVSSDDSVIYFAARFSVYALNADGTSFSSWQHNPVQLSNSTGQSGPVLTQAAVYIGTGKQVDCLNADSGDQCWHPPFTAGSRVVSVPVVGNGVGTIYFGTLAGDVYAVTPGGRLLRVR